MREEERPGGRSWWRISSRRTWSQREFAQERGLPLSNLRYWIYRLRKESRPLVTGAAERSDQVPEQVTAGEGSRLVPVHDATGCGGFQRSVPTGGAAKGMPR